MRRRLAAPRPPGAPGPLAAAVLAVAAALAVLLPTTGCIDAFRQGPVAPADTTLQDTTRATWTHDVAPLFSRSEAHCLNCHSTSGGRTLGFDATGYALETYAQATGADRGGTHPVVPGDPVHSPLVWRLEGHTDTGAPILRMPLDGPPYLADAQIAVVRRWIAAGAPER